MYNVICPRMSTTNDELVSPLASVELEKFFFHLIKSPAHVLIIQFSCTLMHIYKDCSYAMHDPYAFRQLEYCKLWNRSGLFYPCLEDTRAGCDKCASKRKVSMHERSRKQSLSLEVTALLCVRGGFFCWQLFPRMSKQTTQVTENLSETEYQKVSERLCLNLRKHVHT